MKPFLGAERTRRLNFERCFLFAECLRHQRNLC
jgi:hypothetical protein